MSVPSSSLDAPTDSPRPSLATDLTRAADATRLATGALVLSAIALALFFGGVAPIFGPINDLLLGAVFVLLVPAVLVTSRLARRRWFTVLAIIAVAGIAELVIGQLLLVSGIIGLQASFATLGIGFLAFATWATALAALALRRQLLTPVVGRWAVGFAVALVSASLAWALLPLAAWSVFGVALLVAFVGWLVSVDAALRGTAERVG